jgi:hypothetical protein
MIGPLIAGLLGLGITAMLLQQHLQIRQVYQKQQLVFATMQAQELVYQLLAHDVAASNSPALVFAPQTQTALREYYLLPASNAIALNTADGTYWYFVGKRDRSAPKYTLYRKLLQSRRPAEALVEDLQAFHASLRTQQHGQQLQQQLQLTLAFAASQPDQNPPSSKTMYFLLYPNHDHALSPSS